MTRQAKYKKESILNILKNNNGTSMIETLVSFVVLVIILAILMHMVNYCFNLQMKAADTDTVFNKFNAELYKPVDKIDTHEVSAKEIKTNENLGPVFYLMVDTDKTSMDQNVKDPTGTDYLSYKLGLYNIKVNSYKSVNGLIESEKLVTPQALLFDYEK